MNAAGTIDASGDKIYLRVSGDLKTVKAIREKAWGNPCRSYGGRHTRVLGLGVLPASRLYIGRHRAVTGPRRSRSRREP